MRTEENLHETIRPYLTEITDNCILYPIINEGGYGDIQYKNNKGLKRHYLAHRLAFEVHNDVKLDSEQLILHSCDVPNCINPKHLRIGTHKENSEDKIKRNRHAKGKINGRYVTGYSSKYEPVEKPKSSFETLFNRSLTEGRAKELKKAIKNKGNKSLKKLSEELGVEYQTIRDLSCGRIYKNI